MDLDALLQRYFTFAEEGAWEQAADLLREQLSDFDEEPAVHCWLGVAERELGLEGVAYERFKRALSLDPQDPYVLATAGNGLAYFDDPDAEQALRAAALIAPDVSVGRLLYGAYLAREGFHERALEQLEAAREIDPDDPQIAYELGVAHAFASSFERSADALADSVRLDPEAGWTRVVFGLVLLEDGRLEEAVGELVSGARLSEDDVEAQLAAALASAAAGHEDGAYELLERARIRASEGDVALLSAVEDRIDDGHEAASRLLEEEIAPNLLRTRIAERP